MLIFVHIFESNIFHNNFYKTCFAIEYLPGYAHATVSQNDYVPNMRPGYSPTNDSEKSKQIKKIRQMN